MYQIVEYLRNFNYVTICLRIILKFDAPIVFSAKTKSSFFIDKTIPLTTLAKPAQPIRARIIIINPNLCTLVMPEGKIAARIINR